MTCRFTLRRLFARITWSRLHSALLLTFLLHFLVLFMIIVFRPERERNNDFTLFRPIESVPSDVLLAGRGGAEKSSGGHGPRLVVPVVAPFPVEAARKAPVSEPEVARERPVLAARQVAEESARTPDGASTAASSPLESADGRGRGAPGGNGRGAGSGDGPGGGAGKGPGDGPGGGGGQTGIADGGRFGKENDWLIDTGAQGGPVLVNTGAWDALGRKELEAIGSASVRIVMTIAASGGHPRAVRVIAVAIDDPRCDTPAHRRTLELLGANMARDSNWAAARSASGAPVEAQVDVTIVLKAGAERKR